MRKGDSMLTEPMFLIRWSDTQFCNLISGSCDEGRIHLYVLQFGLQQLGLDGVKGAG